MTKNNTEITTGNPKPPFRIMVPRGAPMKKKMRQAKLNVNFLCHSFLCFLILRSWAPRSCLLNETLSLAFREMPTATSSTALRASGSRCSSKGH